jgi:hypothetical protein
MRVLLIVLCLSLSYLSVAQSDRFNELFDQLLSTYVNDGKVNYAGIKANQKLVNQIDNAYDRVLVLPTDDRELLAFHLNTYNYQVIKKVLGHYPLESVKEIDDFFLKPRFDWVGEPTSLDELERLLFYRFPDDPRLHFMLVCAAKGCPNLGNRAFTKDNLQTILKQTTRDVLKDPKIVNLDPENNTVKLSKIFKWYQADFKRKGSILEYINYHRQEDIPLDYKIEYMDYDWSLNGE